MNSKSNPEPRGSGTLTPHFSEDEDTGHATRDGEDWERAKKDFAEPRRGM